MKKIARLLPRLFPPLAGAAFGICATLLFLPAAFADPVGTIPPIPGVDWNFWLAVIGAAAGVASLLLHKFAPKSVITQDLDAMLAWWKNRATPDAPTVTESVKAGVIRVLPDGTITGVAPPLTVAKAPGSGTAGLLAVLLLGALAAPAMTACHTAPVQQLKDEGSAAVSSTLDCAKKLGPGQLEAGLVVLAGDIATAILSHGAIDWGALAAAAIADVTEVKACALAEYHAVTSKQTSPAAEAKLMSVNAPPVNALASAVAKVKAARGVTAIVTPGGSV